jgi:hypothetical protein
MTKIAEKAWTGDDAGHADDPRHDETDTGLPEIPPEIVGTTNDIVARDWVGAGHTIPEEPDGESDDEPGPESQHTEK